MEYKHKQTTDHMQSFFYKKNMNVSKGNISHLFSHSHNCVVGELGVEGRRGQPQPSAGFYSIYPFIVFIFFKHSVTFMKF